jgi:hypothetical protein
MERLLHRLGVYKELVNPNKNTQKEEFVKTVGSTLLKVCLIAQATSAYAIFSQWDSALCDMAISDVNVNADSVANAWTQICVNYNLRSNIVIDAGEQKIPFSFRAAGCIGKNLLDKLVSNYTGYAWKNDPNTGIIWLKSQKCLNNDILKSRFTISSDQLGVPMQKGVLEQLEASSNGKIRVQKGGTPFENTFNYPVEIPKGPHTLLEILDLCCAADPSKSFCLIVYENYITIAPLNLFSMRRKTPSPGAVLFWRIEIGEPNGMFPSDSEILSGYNTPQISYQCIR